MSVKSSISLTDQQDAFARSLVETGRYSSLSSVLQQGLELLRQKTEAEAAETEGRRRLIQQRIDGPNIPAAIMLHCLFEWGFRLRAKPSLIGCEPVASS